MAYQPARSHKHGDRAEAHDGHRKSKSSKSHKHSSKPVPKHPTKQPEAISKRPKASKAKKTVSIAGVFERARSDGKKHRKHKEPTPIPEPETDLRDYLREGIEEARTAIDARLHAAFDAVHGGFVDRLSASRARDVAFFESVSATATMLSAPLEEEEVETTFMREGKRVTEVVDIGKRIALFKKSIERDEAKLRDYWNQWEGLQDDFLLLGIDVFGPEVFGIAAVEAETRGKSFKKEMESLDLEHDAKVQELIDEVEGIGEHFLEKMKESEKELDTSTRRQQAQLLQALCAD